MWILLILSLPLLVFVLAWWIHKSEEMNDEKKWEEFYRKREWNDDVP